jgi:hypothetical protein
MRPSQTMTPVRSASGSAANHDVMPIASSQKPSARTLIRKSQKPAAKRFSRRKTRSDLGPTQNAPSPSDCQGTFSAKQPNGSVSIPVHRFFWAGGPPVHPSVESVWETRGAHPGGLPGAPTSGDYRQSLLVRGPARPTVPPSCRRCWNGRAAGVRAGLAKRGFGGQRRPTEASWLWRLC